MTDRTAGAPDLSAEALMANCAHYGGLPARCMFAERKWSPASRPKRCSVCPEALAARAEAAEPVAWFYTHPDGAKIFGLQRGKIPSADWTETPLYAHPPTPDDVEDTSREQRAKAVSVEYAEYWEQRAERAEAEVSRLVAERDLPPAPLPSREEIAEAVFSEAVKSMRTYRLSNMQDEDSGDLYPLVDALSNTGKSIREGEEQIEFIADAFCLQTADAILALFKEGRP